MVSGSVTNEFGWKAGFVAAGVGMIVSLVMQMTMAQSWLGDIGRVPAAKRDLAIKKSAKKEPLTKEEVDRIKVILVMSLFTIVFWAASNKPAV